MFYGYDIMTVEVFVLVFIRIATALMLMPVFEHSGIPVQVKLSLGLILAAILTPVAQMQYSALPEGMFPLISAALSEALVGVVFGLVTMLVLVGAQFAGGVVGIQMGFGIAQQVDPQFGGQSNIIASLNYQLALVIFVIMDVHLHFLETLGQSFALIPLGGAIFSPAMLHNFGNLSAEIFIIGVKLAAPVMAIIFLVQVGLGFITRVMPKMNVFIVGYPVKIGVGMMGIVVSFPLFIYVLLKAFDYYEHGLMQFVALLTGR